LVTAPTLSADPLAGLTPDQRTWAMHSAELWDKAHALAHRAPGSDPSDIYHALRCLELAPAERLRNALTRGRLRTYAR
jgi:hypothetical protein